MKTTLLETYLAQHGSECRFVEPKDLHAGVSEPFTLIDVREAHEFDAGRINAAINVPRGRLEMDIEQRVSASTAPILLICKSGRRAQLAAITLLGMGFTTLYVLRGGMDAWVALGAPTEGGEGLTADEHERYARHLALPDFSSAQQQALKSKRVLVVGCGGLGSPAIAYLAAAGVGRLRLADADRVDVSNLQRQVIHRTPDVGILKTISAERFVNALNPHVDVEVYSERVAPENVMGILEGVDIVLDGSDNVETRYCLNHACYESQIPYVYGAVFRDEGECTIFDFSRGDPCYRCLHPVPLPPELSPNCSVSGVLGVVPGVVGCLQANFVLQYFSEGESRGETKLSRIRFDDLSLTQFGIQRNPNCRTCGSIPPRHLD